MREVLMKKLFLIVIFTTMLTLLIGQQTNWHVYRSAGGASDIAYRNGELWISSAAGIMRWNPDTGAKTQYDNFNAPSQVNTILNLCTSQNGDIWGCGSYGVVHYDGTAWEYFDSTNSILPFEPVYCLTADNAGVIWMVTVSGVYSYNGTVWTVFNSSNSDLLPITHPWGITVAPNNHIWICSDDGVWRYNGSTWTNFTAANSTLPDDWVYCIAFEADGTGWFGNYDGVAKYENNTWQNYPSINGVSLTRLNGVYVDAMQRIWYYNNDNLLMDDHGVYHHYPRTQFADYTLWFGNLLIDDFERIWIVFWDTYSPKSLAKFDGENATFFAISELPLASRYVQDIFKGFDSKLWIATSNSDGIGGYISIDEDEVDAFGMYNTEMQCDHVWALAQDSQMNIWVSTCVGLLRIGDDGTQHFGQTQAGISTGNLKTICPIGDGVWIGGSEGVSRYQNGTWSLLSSAEAGINLEYTKTIKKDNEGGIWIGGNYGICRYFNGQFIAYPQITNAKDFAFAADGSVWVARGELSYLHNGTWIHFNTTNSGLLENHANCVAVDHNNKVWVGSFFPNCVLYSYREGQWQVFDGTNSRLSGNQLNALYVDADNTKWIGGKDLYIFNETGLPSSSEEQLLPVAKAIGNYPNPFVAFTTIRCQKESAEPLQLNIYNLKGQKVWSHAYRGTDKGEIEISWNGQDTQGLDCAAGIYIIQQRDKHGVRVGKILKLAHEMTR